MKVFIMWSGERSRQIAIKLQEFFEAVVQRPQYFVSTDNIQPGVVWENIVAGELKTTHFGVACLAKDSLQSLWIHFEAGSISKIGENSRVVPYLIDIDPSEVVGPLAKFQSTPANKEGTFSLVESINDALPESDQTGVNALRTAFEGLWPTLEKVISHYAQPSSELEVKPRTNEDLLREILIRLRGVERQVSNISISSNDTGGSPYRVEEKYIEAVKKYAFEKAKSTGWSRPEMYFDEEEIWENTVVPRKLAYFALDSLRERGLVTCLNWKGESIWMASVAGKTDKISN